MSCLQMDVKTFYRKSSQKLTQAIKSLQRTLDEAELNTRIAEERLSELSVNVSVLSIIGSHLIKYILPSRQTRLSQRQ